MTEYGMFPVSVIIAGFCVMSLAYLICFCCCIIQFFVRRSRTADNPLASSLSGTPITKKKNDKLKNRFWRQYINSLRRFNKNRPSGQFLVDSACVGFCPICFEEYKGDPADTFVGLIKVCEHFFHFNCIWEWLEHHQTCPLCRGPTKLQESDIKGLALRHVGAYKESALAVEKGEKVLIVPDTSEDIFEVGTSGLTDGKRVEIGQEAIVVASLEISLEAPEQETEGIPPEAEPAGVSSDSNVVVEVADSHYHGNQTDVVERDVVIDVDDKEESEHSTLPFSKLGTKSLCLKQPLDSQLAEQQCRQQTSSSQSDTMNQGHTNPAFLTEEGSI